MPIATTGVRRERLHTARSWMGRVGAILAAAMIGILAGCNGAPPADPVPEPGPPPLDTPEAPEDPDPIGLPEETGDPLGGPFDQQQFGEPQLGEQQFGEPWGDPGDPVELPPVEEPAWPDEPADDDFGIDFGAEDTQPLPEVDGPAGGFDFDPEPLPPAADDSGEEAPDDGLEPGAFDWPLEEAEDYGQDQESSFSEFEGSSWSLPSGSDSLLE